MRHQRPGREAEIAHSERVSRISYLKIIEMAALFGNCQFLQVSRMIYNDAIILALSARYLRCKLQKKAR